MDEAVLSPEKRSRAMSLLRHGSVTRMTAERALVYAIGLIVCDADGYIIRADVDAALQDPVKVAVAKELLRRARS